MPTSKKVIENTILSILALSVGSAVAAAQQTAAQPAEPAMEKCYAIVKAGMNDCTTKTTSCAGSATKDSQTDAYILLPKGTCKKIVGASLVSK